MTSRLDPTAGTPDRAPASRYRHEIDGLRAIAITAVILNHFNPELLPSGFLGVEVFFAISGFVVTSALSRKRGASGGAFFRDFCARRVKRLFPSLVTCVAVTGFVACLFLIEPETSLQTGTAALFGVSNLYLMWQSVDYFGGSAALNLFTQTWALGVEEQFYLLFPALVYLCGFSGKPRSGGTRNLFVVVASLSLLSLGLYLWLSRDNAAIAYFLTPARLWEIGFGCLMFPIARRFSGVGDRYKPAASAVLLGLLTIAFFAPQDWQVGVTIGTVAISILLLFTLDAPGAVARSLAHPWLTYIGRLSYALYLWHWSVLTLSRWTIGISKWTIPIQLVLIIAIAVFSYHRIEQPLRYAQWSPSSLKTIGYGLSCAIATAAALMLLTTPPARALYTGEDVPEFQRNPYGMFYRYKQCEDARAASDDFAECSYTRDDTANPNPKTLYLIGDSHALALKPLVVRLLEERHVDRIVQPGCFFSERLQRRGNSGRECLASNAALIPKVQADSNPGDIVAIANRYKPYFLLPSSPEDIELSKSGGYMLQAGDERLSKQDALARYTTELAELADRLAAKDLSLVVFAPLPDWKHQPYECEPEWFRPRWLHPGTCRLSAERKSAYREPVITAFERADTESPALHVYDPFPLFCDAENCSAIALDGTPLFVDDDHLNPRGAESIYPDFVEFLDRRSILN